MSSAESVTTWIGQLKAGDAQAAQPLWDRYFQRLVQLAYRKLGSTPRRAADEEDVALSAFDSFCLGAEQGRFPQLQDRDNLWPLLVKITERKAIDLVHHEKRLKRGGGAVQDEAALADPQAASAADQGMDQFPGPEPTPEFAAQLAEECQRLLAELPEENLRAVAVWKLEGYTNEEIRTELDCSERTVERKLRLIRQIWEKDIVP